MALNNLAMRVNFNLRQISKENSLLLVKMVVEITFLISKPWPRQDHPNEISLLALTQVQSIPYNGVSPATGAYHRLRNLAHTIADTVEIREIQSAHLAEALQYHLSRMRL